MNGRKSDNVYKKGRFWWGEFMVDGRTTAFSTGLENRKDAVRIVQTRKKAALAARPGANGATPGVTFDQAAEIYWETRGALLKDIGNNNTSKDTALSATKRAVQAVGSGTLCRDIDDGFMLALRARLCDSFPMTSEGVPRTGGAKMSPSTVNGIMSKVIAILRSTQFVVGRFPDFPDPAASKLYLPTQNRGRYLKDTEEARLRPACDQDLWDLVDFDLETGLRADELATLKWDDIDWSEESITVMVKGKGRQPRPHTIFLSESALALLHRRLATGIDDVNVFTLRALKTYWLDDRLVETGTPIPASYSLLKSRFRAACKAGKIDGLILHDLRRTAARRIFWVSDIEIAQAFLGHTDRQTTLDYLCLTSADTKAAVRHREKQLERRRAEIAAALAAGRPAPALEDVRIARLRAEFSRLSRLGHFGAGVDGQAEAA